MRVQYGDNCVSQRKDSQEDEWALFMRVLDGHRLQNLFRLRSTSMSVFGTTEEIALIKNESEVSISSGINGARFS